MTQTRAERRREKHAAKKAEQYAKTKFKDRAVYRCAVDLTPRRGYDMFGNPKKGGPFSATELHQRAVERRDRKRMVEKMVREQIDASKEATKARKAGAKASRRAAYLAGCAKPQPVEHMHSAARVRHYASITPAKMAA